MKNLTRTFGTISTLLAITAPVEARDLAAAAREEPRAAHAEGTQDQLPGGRARGPRRPLPPEVTERFIRTVRLGDREGFELVTGAAGQVTINGVSGESVRIEALKRTWHANREAGIALLQTVQVRITERGGIVEAITDFTERGAPAVVVDYTVSLPTRAGVTLRTIRGDIRVSNVKGELRIDAANGDITLSSVGDVRRARTVAGNVVITNAEGDELIAESVGGSLQVRNVRVETMELSTFMGRLTAVDVRCARCSLKSVNGEIELSGQLTRGGRYDLQTQKGDIRVIPAGRVSFDLEARTLGPRPRSDFPLDPSGPPREGTLRGSYGEEGGAVLSITSFSGNVSIERR